MENDVSEPIASSLVPSTEELFIGPAHKKRLNQWLATGICGNDITSFCLYVSAIAAVYAGVLAPVVLVLVVLVLARMLYVTALTLRVRALMLDVPTQVKMRARTVACRFESAVFMMHMRKTQALVGQRQNDEQESEDPAHRTQW